MGKISGKISYQKHLRAFERLIIRPVIITDCILSFRQKGTVVDNKYH